MCKHPTQKHLPRSVSRRDVLRFTLGGVGIAALGPTLLRNLPVASGAPQDITRYILINMVGGNDGLNTVIPRTLSEYYSRRPQIQIPAGQELALTGGANSTTLYGLHPALDQIRTLWQEGSVAAVQRVGYPNANLSHFTSGDIYSYGVRDSFSPLGIDPSGWIARYADQFAPTPMGAVAIGVGRPLDFVGGASNPFTVSNLAGFQFQADPQNAADQQHRLQVVEDVLTGFAGTGLSQETKSALDVGHQLTTQIQAAVTGFSTSVTFPATPLGGFLKDAATLIQGGFETRIFYTGFGGFDTHAGQGAGTGAQSTLLGRLDDAVAAFVQDMKNRNLWNTTRVVIHTEFGRRNYENASIGTDHGHGNCWLVLGGGINGGSHGPNLTSPDLQGEYPAYAVDFRDVHRDVLESHLGVPDADTVFPEAQPISTTLGIA